MLLVALVLAFAVAGGGGAAAVELGPATRPTLVGAEVPSLGAAGTWRWPVVGPVIRGFEQPNDPYGSGHRGIDIAAAFGTPVVSPAAGTVTFAGKVGGELFVTIDHGGGVRSTDSWLSAILVRTGDVVAEGEVVALSGAGHPGSSTPHLHFGVRADDAYVDPMTFLGPPSVAALIHLAPLLATGA